MEHFKLAILTEEHSGDAQYVVELATLQDAVPEGSLAYEWAYRHIASHRGPVLFVPVPKGASAEVWADCLRYAAHHKDFSAFKATTDNRFIRLKLIDVTSTELGHIVYGVTYEDALTAPETAERVKSLTSVRGGQLAHI